MNYLELRMAEIAKKQRIEYIDLAKGFCILLVVFSHIIAFYRTALPYDCMLKCFRMPLYFFLSGVFFKQYENFGGFLKRKINKLVIPFFFFYITLGVILPYVLYRWAGVKILIFNPEYTVWQNLVQFAVDERFPNTAIWFLISLFEVNIMFYLIFMFARKVRWHSTYIIAGLSVACGVAGMVLSACRVNLLCFLDTSLTSVPYFALGYILNRKTRVMQKGWRYDKYIGLIVLVSVLILIWLAYPLDYRTNYFANCYTTAHICGVVGTLMTLFVAKLVGKVPLITYWGRYSIMILVTHQIVYQLLHLVLKHYFQRGWLVVMVSMCITMALYLILIPLMRRFLPHVTAQKDVIKI